MTTNFFPQTVAMLQVVKQPSFEDYWFCIKDKTVPFTLRAQVINSWRRNQHKWEKETANEYL